VIPLVWLYRAEQAQALANQGNDQPVGIGETSLEGYCLSHRRIGESTDKTLRDQFAFQFGRVNRDLVSKLPQV
jgi:hypothetical protein